MPCVVNFKKKKLLRSLKELKSERKKISIGYIEEVLHCNEMEVIEFAASSKKDLPTTFPFNGIELLVPVQQSKISHHACTKKRWFPLKTCCCISVSC